MAMRTISLGWAWPGSRDARREITFAFGRAGHDGKNVTDNYAHVAGVIDKQMQLEMFHTRVDLYSAPLATGTRMLQPLQRPPKRV